MNTILDNEYLAQQTAGMVEEAEAERDELRNAESNLYVFFWQAVNRFVRSEYNDGGCHRDVEVDQVLREMNSDEACREFLNDAVDVDVEFELRQLFGTC